MDPMGPPYRYRSALDDLPSTTATATTPTRSGTAPWRELPHSSPADCAACSARLARSAVLLIPRASRPFKQPHRSTLGAIHARHRYRPADRSHDRMVRAARVATPSGTPRRPFRAAVALESRTAFHDEFDFFILTALRVVAVRFCGVHMVVHSNGPIFASFSTISVRSV